MTGYWPSGCWILKESDFDLRLTGFEDDELARLLAQQDAVEDSQMRMTFRSCRRAVHLRRPATSGFL